MEDEEAVYESIAQTMRNFGYQDVTADRVREIDANPNQPQTVVVMFASKQLDDARKSGRLPPRS
jgi:hypothetical protein